MLLPYGLINLSNLKARKSFTPPLLRPEGAVKGRGTAAKEN